MIYISSAIGVAGFLAGILILLEIGRRLGIRRRIEDPEGSSAGLNAVEGAVFGLMGLLMAFTFSGAASRFDGRRQLIVQEANAIGTAYLRIDLLPGAAQPGLREDFRRYLDARLAFYGSLSDEKAAKAEAMKVTTLQNSIWAQAVAACKEVPSPAVMSLVLAALNEMIDITTTRSMALQTHPPKVIFMMLGMLILASSLLAGYGMAGSKGRSLTHILGFAIMLTLTVYVIVDLEFPRFGLIRIDAADQVLIELRQSMK